MLVAKLITWAPHGKRCTTGDRLGSDRPLQPSIDTGPYSQPFGRQDPSLPQVFGRYLLVQRLSRGGMGEIFLAKHGLLGFEKLAVIKKVLPNLSADDQFISRFVDEAQVAIKLQHVNVAQVFEVGRVGSEYFLALEYIDGRDLRRILGLLGHRKQRLPVDLSLFIARELANGLAYAHRRTTSDGASLNLVHCDISPPNVLVSFEGETKVIDFGIAKSAMRATTTDPKLGFGKFGYMAPEQLIRGGVVDHRTDIYAAGVVLFELLTGTRLYEAGPQPDYRALARKVARGEFPLASQVDPALAIYDDLVAIALRPRPEDRYQSAAELRDAIQQCLVAVNPTISTDQLGAYLRELFSEEMTAQRELHERVASAHLADFQEQLHTQTETTISFALAQLPLQPPDATGPVLRPHVPQPTPVPRSRSGNTGPQPAIPPPAMPRTLTGPQPVVSRTITGPQAALARIATGQHAVGPQPTAPGTATAAAQSIQSPAFDTLAPQTDALDSITLDGAATIVVGGGSMVRMRAQRRRQIAIAAISALVVVVAFGLWSLATSDGASRAGSAAAIAPPPPPPKPQIIVEPIPVEQARAEAAGPNEIEMLPNDSPSATARPPNPARTVRSAAPPDTHRTPRARPGQAAPSPTREQLVQKFQQVRRDYDDYKAKFGSRLEKEWGDLAMFIQYVREDDAWRVEAARRLDEFRSRMRE
jgi:serine/threonine protein kinase